MYKWLVLFGVMLALVSILAACGQDASINDSERNSTSDEVFELNFTHVQPADHPTNIAAEWLADELEERTDGQVTLSVYPNGALGGPDELIAGMGVGDVDLVWLSTAEISRYIQEFNIFGVSYLIQDNDHFARLSTMDSNLMNELAELVLESDIEAQLVGMMGGSPRRLYNTERAVHTPDDLQGLNLRVQDSSVEAEIWNALGATPVPLAWDEIYTALSSGVVHGAESSTLAYMTNQFYEVAPYHSLTEHQYMFLPVFMSNKVFEELPEDLLDIVLEAVEEASYKTWEIYWEEEEEIVSDLIDKGIEVNEVDTAPFIDKVAPIADKAAEENNAQRILELIREEVE